MSTNRDLANLFREMARMLELEKVEWKPRAYLQAAYGIEDLSQDVKEIYERGGKKALQEIPGVGKSIADHIAEYIEKGRIEKFEKLRKKHPQSITDLVSIEGIGPRTAQRLVDELKISSLEDLERAAREHRISKLEGFGRKKEKNILEAIEVYRGGHGRMLISVALPIAEEIVSYLKESAPLQRIDYVGSLRRMKETIGDVDLLAISDNAKEVMKAFTEMMGVKKVISRGPTRSSIVLKEKDVQVDIRVIRETSYAAALMYFTGSKDHNIALRKEAIKKGYKLSEYGLFESRNKLLPFKSEEEIYKKLGMDYIAPELRENRGEIDAAKKGTLPGIVSEKDIRGDFHIHTSYSDGSSSIEEMVKAAQDLGYEYMAITDHSPTARIARGMNEKKIRKQWREIDGIAEKYRIKVLKGAEVDILNGGELDYPKEILEELDIVIGSVHSSLKMPKEKMTARIMNALENEHLDILGHPTGRLIGKRPPYEADYSRIFEAATENGKVLEIDGQPERMDLNDSNILAAREHGAKFCIDTDSKSASNLGNMRYGLGMARRGWLTREDVVNTYPYNRLKKIFERG
jgi:DNA polymerase (family 10)